MDRRPPRGQAHQPEGLHLRSLPGAERLARPRRLPRHQQPQQPQRGRHPDVHGRPRARQLRPGHEPGLPLERHDGVGQERVHRQLLRHRRTPRELGRQPHGEADHRGRRLAVPDLPAQHRSGGDPVRVRPDPVEHPNGDERDAPDRPPDVGQPRGQERLRVRRQPRSAERGRATGRLHPAPVRKHRLGQPQRQQQLRREEPGSRHHRHQTRPDVARRPQGGLEPRARPGPQAHPRSSQRDRDQRDPLPGEGQPCLRGRGGALDQRRLQLRAASSSDRRAAAGLGSPGLLAHPGDAPAGRRRPGRQAHLRARPERRQGHGPSRRCRGGRRPAAVQRLGAAGIPRWHGGVELTEGRVAGDRGGRGRRVWHGSSRGGWASPAIPPSAVPSRSGSRMHRRPDRPCGRCATTPSSIPP